MTDLQVLHNAMYTLLYEIDDICKKYNIAYYLHGGSVIGAVRHGGIIPWDDDVDIAMKREDWQKFVSIVDSMHLKDRVLATADKYNDWPFTYGQYRDTTATVLYKSGLYTNFPRGTFIDVIILDPISGEDELIKNHVESLKLLSELRCKYYVCNRETNYGKYKWLKRTGKVIGMDTIIRRLEQSLIHDEKCDGYIQRVGVYPVFWDKKFFQEPVYLSFGERLLPVPSNTREYLRYTYGDSWMMYPDGVGKDGHGFLYLSNVNKNQLVKDYNPYINEDQYKKAWQNYKKYRFKAIQFEDVIDGINAKRSAALYALEIKNKLKNTDLVALYKNTRYKKIREILGWYIELQLQKNFIKYKIGIPLDVQVVYFACMVLILTGEYYKANKILECYGVHDNALYDELIMLIGKTRDLSIAVYDEQNDGGNIINLVKEVLPKYPHHVDFIAAKCNLLIKQNMDSKYQAERLCQEELALQKDNIVLTECLADIELSLNRVNDASNLYQYVYDHSNNGMMRLDIEIKAAEFGFALVQDTVEKKEVDTDRYTEMVRIAQSKIQDLLTELHDICRKHDISYFLGGYLAAEAVELGTFAPECCSAYIVLHPKDRKRFYEAVNTNLGIDRFIESMENNEDYPDFSMRYGDINTVVFDEKEEGFYKNHALCINIYFVRPYIGNNFVRKFNNGLNAAIEAIAFPSVYDNISTRKVYAGIMARAASYVLGKKNLKKLAWYSIYQLKKTPNRIQGSIKNYWHNEIFLPEIDYSFNSTCWLNDKEYCIPENYDSYNKPQVRRNWNTGKPVGELLKNNVKASMFADCREFYQQLRILHKGKMYFAAWKKLSRINDRCHKEASYGYGYAWNMAYRTFMRFKLWQKYAPLKDKISALYDNGDFKALKLILNEYIKVLEDNNQRGIAVVFDEDIFRITWEVLQKEDKSYIIRNVLSKIPDAYWNKILICCGKVNEMRKTETSQQKEILNYLHKDVVHCLYMYADIAKYGVEGENISVYCDYDDIGIRMVVMKYHNNFQVYSSRGFDEIEGLVGLVQKYKPTGISGRKEIIANLAAYFKGKYRTEYGLIFQGKEIDKTKIAKLLEDCPFAITLAKESEAEEIAQLICLDEELSSVYTEESLAEELRERILSGMGRSYIIRQDGKIVAHNATYAEADDFVVISGLMVHPDYRNTDYAYWMDLKSSFEFQQENKKRYFFALDKKLIKLYKHMKSPLVGEYGKMSFKRDIIN